MLPIHEQLSKTDLSKCQMVFDATSLCPSAVWDKNSVYPKVKSGFNFTPHMNDVYVEAFNNQTFNQDGNESAILKINFYKPRDLIYQHLPVEKKVKKIEVNRIRNGYIIDILTSIDIQGIVKNGGKVIQIYEGVNIGEKFKISPLEKL